MGILGRIFSRKKKEGKELNLKEESIDNSNVQQVPQTQQFYEDDDKEFQVLLSKLDTLNVKLEMINQRLINLERLAEKEEPEQKW